MRLSMSAQQELEYMRQQVRDNPEDEAEPSGRWDWLPQSEKDYIVDTYYEMGGK